MVVTEAKGKELRYALVGESSELQSEPSEHRLMQASPRQIRRGKGCEDEGVEWFSETQKSKVGNQINCKCCVAFENGV